MESPGGPDRERQADPPGSSTGSDRRGREPGPADPETERRTSRSGRPAESQGDVSRSRTSPASDGSSPEGPPSVGSSQEGPPSVGSSPEGPPREAAGGGGGSSPSLAADVLGSVLAVGLLGVLLFAASGVWPPMVAVESTSMTPHMDVGDLVFVMEEERFPGAGAHRETGVVSARAGTETGYRKFQGPGDVIVFSPNGNGGATPIIHRAMFWVEAGENWYDEADHDYLGRASSCAELSNCPAPHAGFITKGDANGRYDQVGSNPFSGPVKPDWILGTAEVRVPWLGCIRLASQANAPSCQLLATGPAVR